MKKLLAIILAVIAGAITIESRPQQQVTFTAEQAERGSAVFGIYCSSCHGQRLDDGTAPALKSASFVSSWTRPGRTVDDLIYLMRTSMPVGAAGTLSAAQYIDVAAYILHQNGFGAGSQPLPSDSTVLRAMTLGMPEPGVSPPSRASGPSFISGDSTSPSSSVPTQAEINAATQTYRDWLYHTADYTGKRYSGLNQINASNAAQLRPACIFQMGEESNFQTGPIVYNGTMIVTTIHLTIALDAATCRPIWKHEWKPLAEEVWMVNRGVALKDGHAVRGTSDGYLLSLDAKTGKLLWARRVADSSLGETFTMAPMIWEDRILIGPAGSENAISGWVGAFRLSDGEPLWKFKTVPGAREGGAPTWANPRGIPLGGGAVWTPLSLDVPRGELYVAVTNPAPDLPADLRPGPNLYTNSIVALDVKTGQLRWYEQMTPNDDHDWDLTQVSPLFETRVGGKERSFVATVGKDGVLRTLDRITHERIYEVAVTTRDNVEARVTTEGVRACPGMLGGVEWNGPAYHPQTNSLIVPAVDWCSVFTREDDVRFIEGELYLGGRVRMSGSGTGWINSVDASTGAMRWRYESSRPMVAAVTTTAGGIVLSGELTGDFIVLDARTGNVLYRFNTGGPIGGGLVTYQANGKQFIAVASGNPSGYWTTEHPGSPTIVVFSLP